MRAFRETVSCLAAAFFACAAAAQDTPKDIAEKAKANIAETRGYIARFNSELHGWSSGLDTEIAKAKADAAQWDNTAQGAEGDRKTEATQYQGAYESHVQVLGIIQRSVADFEELSQALESDQVLLEACQNLVEKTIEGGSRSDARALSIKSIEEAFDTLQRQDAQAQLRMHLMARYWASSSKKETQMKALMAALGERDPAASWRWEVRENDIRLNADEMKQVDIGGRLADLVLTILRKSAATLRLQTDMLKAAKKGV